MLYRQNFNALGSRVEFLINIDKNVSPKSIFYELYRQVIDFEKQFSRFQPTSELSLFNRLAGSWQKISPQFLDILCQCLNFSKQTDGVFNPFILPALHAVGYRNSLADYSKQLKNLDYSSRNVVSWHKLEIKNNLVRIPSDSALDLGGIGKGYLGDQLAKFLISNYKKFKMIGFFISLGGDVICYGYNLNSKPWQVTLEGSKYFQKDNIIITTQANKLSAIATSSILERSGIHNKNPWHHIIDPKTSQPSHNGLFLGSVKSDSLAWSDVLAKYLLISGDTQKIELKDYYLEGYNDNGTIFYINHGKYIII